MLGPYHPDTTSSLNDLAILLGAHGKLDEALYQQVMAIWQRVLGHDHSDTSSTLNNQAVMWKARGKLDGQSRCTHLQALETRQKVMGGKVCHSSLPQQPGQPGGTTLQCTVCCPDDSSRGL